MIVCVICTYVVAAANIVIAHPGQDAELICSLGQTLVNTKWLINDMGPYGASSLYNGLLDGYSSNSHTNSIIILNITMNDNRNGTNYRCKINGLSSKEKIILYVTSKSQ